MKGSERTEKRESATPQGNGAEVMVAAEATIDQVRDLLFGGAQRTIEQRLAGLQEEMQASMKKLQAEFASELETVQAKLLKLEQDTERKRQDSHKDIGAAISQLGATISGLGSGRTGK